LTRTTAQVSTGECPSPDLAADGADQEALIVGRQDTIHLKAESVSCVDDVMLKDPAGKELKAEWKAVKADEVELKLPLQSAQPGSLTLLVKQYGAMNLSRCSCRHLPSRDTWMISPSCRRRAGHC
jgi:hypothetical protein